MWFYGYFTNGYSVNSTKVCDEIHGNSDVILLLKTEHIYLFKRTTLWKQKAMQNSDILLKYMVTPHSKLPQNFQWLECQTL